MKKVFLLVSLLTLLSFSVDAQVLFNGAATLKKGNWNIGANPALTTGNSSDLALFLHGGYGLGNNSDLGVKLGFGWGGTYFGLDYEKTLLLGKPSISVAGGAHVHSNFGLDGTALITFPLNNLRFTGGLDMDIVFYESGNNDTSVEIPLWLPLNFEIFIQQNLSIVVEGNIGLTNNSYTTFGGGVSFYF